jgi:hypothetical protein
MERSITSNMDYQTAFILNVCVNIKNLRMIAWKGSNHREFHGHHLAWGTRNLELESLDFVAIQAVGLGPLLGSQPTLRSLRLPDKYHGTFNDLLPTHLPCLRSVAGAMEAVMTLVPNRPVEDVETGISAYFSTGGTHGTDGAVVSYCAKLFRQLERSTKPIKRLVLRLDFLGPGSYFGVVRVFRLMFDSGRLILRGLEEFEIKAESLKMPLVRPSFTFSIHGSPRPKAR